MNRLHWLILLLAAALVPRCLRAEWLAEWRAELHFVRLAGGATPFCLGAFRDALWLRRHNPGWPPLLESPWGCGLWLAALASLACFGAFFSPGARNGVVVVARDLSADEYRALKHRAPEAAMYQMVSGRVWLGTRTAADLSLARSGRDLFDLLDIRIAAPPDAPALILTRRIWRNYFNADARIFGRTVTFEGSPAVLAGVIADDLWRFPGRVDGWLIDNRHLSAPQDTGLVLARRSSLPKGLPFRPPDSRIPMLHSPGGLLILLVSCLLLPSVTSLSLGEYPGAGIRRWVFLALKTLLVLTAVYAGCLYLGRRTEWGGSPQCLLVGLVLGLRWVLVDQRRRCPVCLRRLSSPVHIGDRGHAFLDWNGTELVCPRGHGLLHVAEFPASWTALQRWVRLDPSWSGLFR